MVLSFKNVIQLYEKSELVLARIKENPLKIFFFFLMEVLLCWDYFAL